MLFGVWVGCGMIFDRLGDYVLLSLFVGGVVVCVGWGVITGVCLLVFT